MAVDPRKFLLNTDYEMDKIIYFKEQLLTPDQYGDVSINHNLSTAPLITGIWSKTADFSEPHTLSGIGGVFDPSLPGYSVDTITCSANDTELQFSQYSGSYYSPNRFPFYVRLIGFEPSGSHRDFDKTSQKAKTFILNTDYNYLKLFKSGAEDVHYNSGSGTYDPVTIQHNLGYHPQALFWIESSSTGYHDIRPINGVALPNVYTDKQGVESHTNRFVIYPPIIFGNTHKIQYRIYYDQAK